MFSMDGNECWFVHYFYISTLLAFMSCPKEAVLGIVICNCLHQLYQLLLYQHFHDGLLNANLATWDGG